MDTAWTDRGEKRRSVRILALCLAAMTAIGQTGCTALSEWVHNGFKVGPN